MASINKDSNDGEVFLVHEESNIVDGERRSVEAFSDGSRKHYVNGVLVHDQEVTGEIEPVADANVNSLTATDKQNIRNNFGADGSDFTFRGSPPLEGGVDEAPGDVDHFSDDPNDPKVDRVVDENGEPVDGTPVPESDLTPSQTAEIVALHGAGASGELNDFGSQEPTLVPDGDGGVELQVHEDRPEGEDFPVFVHTPPESEQLAGVPTVESDPKTAEDADAEAAEAAKDKSGAVSDTPGEDVEGDTEVDDDNALEYKSVAELRDHAKSENINLHGATTKQAILDAIEQGDKNE